MRYQTTTWMRALEAARKLQPTVRQINDSLMFDCASTSTIDVFHHVYLGANRVNVLLRAECDCGNNKYGCVHKTAALLQYTSNLEARLWKGCDYIVAQEILQLDTDEVYNLWQDLLDRYERNCDLVRAIELGWNINDLTEPFKDRLPSKTPDKEFQLLTA